VRLLFVGGCERSGTTLLQRILCSHTRIVGGPELVFTGRIARLFERMRGPLPEHFSARLATYYDEARLRSLFRDFLAGLLQPVRERRPDAAYLAEKTPSNFAAATTLLEIFPDARFLHVLRDGRDVLCSHRDVRARFQAAGEVVPAGLGLRRVCGRWNAAIDAHRRLVDEPSVSGRYLSLRYEELVRHPERVIGELLESLELEFEEQVLEPESVPEAESGSVIDGLWFTEEMARRGIDDSGVERWRMDLPPISSLLANLSMASNLRRLGYPVAAAYLPLARLLRGSENRVSKVAVSGRPPESQSR